MFSKIFRLNSRNFNNVFKKGKISFGDYFRMKYLDSDTLRVSVVIPKKIIKKRVNRNTEKRRITHLLKELIPLNTHFSYIFWLTKDSQLLTSEELRKLLKNILKKQK